MRKTESRSHTFPRLRGKVPEGRMGGADHPLRLPAMHPHPALRATFPRKAGEGTETLK